MKNSLMPSRTRRHTKKGQEFWLRGGPTFLLLMRDPLGRRKFNKSPLSLKEQSHYIFLFIYLFSVQAFLVIIVIFEIGACFLTSFPYLSIDRQTSSTTACFYFADNCKHCLTVCVYVCVTSLGVDTHSVCDQICRERYLFHVADKLCFCVLHLELRGLVKENRVHVVRD